VPDIRVVVLLRHALFRAGVIQTLAAEPDIIVVAEGSSAKEVVRLAVQYKPDVMVLDIDVTGNGMKALESVVALCPDVKAVILSGAAEQVRAAMDKGAWGFVLKGCSSAELARSLRLIQGGERYISPALRRRLSAAATAAPAEDQSDLMRGLQRVRRLLGPGGGAS
jgi:two-component system, NarL family, nitrate/nitrite response regulator NarL